MVVFYMYAFANINSLRIIERKLQQKSKFLLIQFYLVRAFYDNPQQLVHSEVRNKQFYHAWKHHID